MGYKIFITTNIGNEAVDYLKNMGYWVDLYDEVHKPSKEFIISKLQEGFDGIITNLRDTIDSEVITAGRDTLKIIAQDSAGTDNIDINTANKYKIPVSNTQDVLTEAVAEFTLFMAGNMSRLMYSSERLVREGKWEGWHPFYPFLGREINNKIIGVIGTGKIGKAFVKKILSLDVDILLYSKTADMEFEAKAGRILDIYYETGFFEKKRTIKYTSFYELLRKSDIISIHTPLIKEGKSSTYHMLTKKEFQLMKKGVSIINTSRGSIIKEDDLIDALKSNIVNMAALDVFEREPLPLDSPLLSRDLEGRVRVYHHFASGGMTTRLSLDHKKGMAGRCIYSLIKVLEGENPANIPYIVNRQIFNQAE